MQPFSDVSSETLLFQPLIGVLNRFISGILLDAPDGTAIGIINGTLDKQHANRRHNHPPLLWLPSISHKKITGL